MSESSTTSSRSDVAVQLRGVSKSYGNRQALDGVDLTVALGEVHALVGLNGAGKTTLLRVLLGIVRQESGSVRIHGREVGTMAAANWMGVGHLIETPLAYPELTVRQNLEAAALLSGVPRREAPRAVEVIIDELNLGAWATKRTRTLSLGNRQRVGLAAALVAPVQLAVLDEPANSLDPAGVVLVRDALRRRAQQGAAVLVSSHHLDEVARIATHITAINDGKVVGELDPKGVDLERQFFGLITANAQESVTL